MSFLQDWQNKFDELKVRAGDSKQYLSEWISERENMQLDVSQFQENMNRMQAHMSSHLNKAFPDQHVTKNFVALEEFAELLHEQMKDKK